MPGADAVRIFTLASHDRFGLVTKARRLQGNLSAMSGHGMTTTSFAEVMPSWTCTATRPPRRSPSSECSARLGLPECATPPQEVYELAKRRGMDFVTITDHDTIAGVLEIADRPDVFISEELTAALPRRAAGRARALLRHHAGRSRVAAGAPRRRRAVRRLHVRARDRVRARAPLLHVAAPLRARHRRRLARAVRRVGGPQRRARA